MLARETLPPQQPQRYFTFYVVTHFTRTLDLQMKRESASSNQKKKKEKKNSSGTCTWGEGGHNRTNVLQLEKHLRDLRRWQHESRGSEQICLWRRAFRQSEFLKHTKKEKKKPTIKTLSGHSRKKKEQNYREHFE